MADVSVPPPQLLGASCLGMSSPRMPPGVPQQACLALVEAFGNKDGQALSRLLDAHPALVGVHLTRRSQPVGRREITLPLLHMAIKINWTKGLDVLARHGADFNQCAEKSGYTALGFAVAQACLPAVRRLLALGALADDPAGSMPALAVLPSVWPKSSSQRLKWPPMALQMMSELLAAGANPWKLVGAEGDKVPATQICLRWGRPELAAALLAVSPPPAAWQQDRAAVEGFQHDWLNSLSKGSLVDHRALLEEMSTSGLLPPLERLLMALTEAEHQPSVYSPSAPTARQVFEDMVERGLQERLFAPLTAEQVELVNKPGLERVHACLLRSWLDQGTPARPIMSRQTQPRL